MVDAGRLVSAATSLARAALRPERPDRLARAVLAMAPWGPSIAGVFAASVGRYPRATFLVDDSGPVSAWQMWVETDALARSLRAHDVGPGVRVGILARNGRAFVQALRRGGEGRRRRRVPQHRRSPGHSSPTSSPMRASTPIAPRRRVRRDRGRLRRRSCRSAAASSPRSSPSARKVPLDADPPRRSPDHPDVGHDRTSKGCARGGVAARRRSAGGLLETCRSAPATPSSSPPRCSTPGVSPTWASCLGMSSTAVVQRRVRPGGDAGRDRRAPCRWPGRRAGDAAAHPRPRCGEVLARYDTSRCGTSRPAARRSARRSCDGGARAASVRCSTTSTARPRSSLATVATPGGPAGGAGDGRAGGAGRRCGSSTSTARRYRPGRPGGCSSAAAPASRATPAVGRRRRSTG